LRAMPQKISGESRSRQLKAEVPLGRWRSRLESRTAGGAFHLIKGDLPTLVSLDNASALWEVVPGGLHFCPGGCELLLYRHSTHHSLSQGLFGDSGAGRIIRGAALVCLIGRTPGNGESPICRSRFLNLMASGMGFRCGSVPTAMSTSLCKNIRGKNERIFARASKSGSSKVIASSAYRR
jgi:hypothetical protein